ncbi:bifunctional folylpolyglutamate synthase/dihydrofolate synthase [Lysinibacillus yapensis]|uniref:tetrahydrofolate synthase n=1 Tax=Ureibacillus yapensis TaxID=2304605 RepID=A0A396SAB4_9BACL|nr:folylpolyglutamate synthase/dihydrofolate synthase family protein [Lysinibacillus yapensis]RHW33367.1 bifunctional folylpolyglutamate synthase/dihydrofolate synthase [Lysinibacillus yapensis]
MRIPKLDEYKKKWNIESEQSIQLGLESMVQALEMLEHPEKELNVVHVAGTNGKGSTIAFLEQLAIAHGLTVGKFMSPCIVDVHDQIQIDGKPISEKELDYIFAIMSRAGLSGKLTDFELLTCAAFLYFAQNNLDVVLIEAGMGGREDSTNVVDPIVSIITSIALEHTKFLGSTIESIASHKAGIIKQQKPVVIGRLPQQSVHVIEQEAFEKESPLIALGDHFDFIEEDKIYTNDERGLSIQRLQGGLPGKHQGDNMALAITAFFELADFLTIAADIEKIREAVKKAKLPGRFEQVLPNVYFDGAHNPQSAEMLIQTIQQQFPNEPIRFVVGMLADKDVKTVLGILETVSDEFYFIDFSNDRAMPASEMMCLSSASIKAILSDNQAFFRQASTFNGKIFVTGSLYLLTELRGQLKNFKEDCGLL